MTPHNASAFPIVGEDNNAKRRQIVDGGRRVFMNLGFDGASMGEIARAAGVSKGTLYVYFADKIGLFEAIVEQETLEQGEAAFDFDLDGSVETTLRQFGQAYIQVLCRPGGGSAVRTVMAIAERMPDVGRRFYENVLMLTIKRLGSYLEAKVASGELAIPDCNLAANQFMETCKATLFLPYIFQAAPAPSSDDIQRVVDSGVRMFLATYKI